MRATQAEARHVTLALAQASDAALSRVVALLDGVGQGHDAAKLLDHARPRLQLLRPPRRLTMARLLFLPLDGAIHDVRDWQHHRAGLPRTVLPALAGQLRAADPAGWASIAESLAQGHPEGAVAMGGHGAPLWAFGARTLGLAAQAGWEVDTGLRVTDHAAMARLCIGVWRNAGSMWTAMQFTSGEVHADRVRAALMPLATEDGAVFSACLATLLKYHPSPGLVISMAGQLGPMPRLVAERQLDEMLAQPLQNLDPARPASSAREAQRWARTLSELESCALAQRPDRRRRLAQQRQSAAEACHDAFTAGLAQRVLPALHAGSTAGATGPALEDTARNLRRLALAGRELGATTRYDAAETTIADALAKSAADPVLGALSRVELARLAEILCGPDAAMRVLGARR